MKTLALALIAAVSFSTVSAFATEGTTDQTETISNRTHATIENLLRDRGIFVSHVEEWGGMVRAWVPNAHGGTDMRFFDADTLQQIAVNRG